MRCIMRCISKLSPSFHGDITTIMKNMVILPQSTLSTDIRQYAYYPHVLCRISNNRTSSDAQVGFRHPLWTAGFRCWKMRKWRCVAAVKTWENHGITMGKPWENVGKPWENIDFCVFIIQHVDSKNIHMSISPTRLGTYWYLECQMVRMYQTKMPPMEPRLAQPGNGNRDSIHAAGYI